MLPIAEHFWSIQGEGLYVGTGMVFLRLAGCNVGKYASPEQANALRGGFLKDDDQLYILPGDAPALIEGKHSICTAADGQKFLCDTDYHRSESATFVDLIHSYESQGIKVDHVCVTGGEPVMHAGLLDEILTIDLGVMVHLETSGTKLLEPLLRPDDNEVCWNSWVTCSPKEGFLKENVPLIDEWKVLCGPHFNLSFFEELIPWQAPLVYIQPIQGIHETDQAAFDRCLEVLKKKPEWRLSAQLHKFLGKR